MRDREEIPPRRSVSIAAACRTPGELACPDPARALEGTNVMLCSLRGGRPWCVDIATTLLPAALSLLRSGAALRSFCMARDSQVAGSRRLWSVCAGLVQARRELLQTQQESAIRFRQCRILQMHGAVSPELQQLVRAQVVIREQGEVRRS